MKKQIDAPATLEEVQKTLGITREDMEIVDRVMKELGYTECDDPSEDSRTSHSSPAPDGTPSFYGAPAKSQNKE